MNHPLATATVALLLAGAAQAADLQNGQALASATCGACHGVDGQGLADDYPNLAGQKITYLMAQLRAFRDGDRANPVMSAVARPLSDQQIADVSAYYANLGCSTATASE